MLRLWTTSTVIYVQQLTSEPTENSLLFVSTRPVLPSLKQVLEMASTSFQLKLFVKVSEHLSHMSSTYHQNSLIWLTSKKTDNISISVLYSFQESLKALHIPRPLNNHTNTNTGRQVQTGKGTIRICTSLIISHRYWKASKLCFYPRCLETSNLRLPTCYSFQISFRLDLLITIKMLIQAENERKSHQSTSSCLKKWKARCL